MVRKEFTNQSKNQKNMKIKDNLRIGCQRAATAFGTATEFGGTESLTEELRHSREKLLQKAEKACEGFIHYSGGAPVQVGRRNIDWLGGHINHQEWHHQLNRFFDLTALAAAFKETEEERFAEAARDYIGDWIQAHPVVENWKPHLRDSSLNMGIRLGYGMQGWMGTLPTFLESRAFDDSFLTKLVESAQCQLNWLAANLPPHANPRVSGAMCLLESSLRLEFLPEAGQWKKFAVVVINDAFRRNVLADGATLERDAHYHNWMKNLYGKCYFAGQGDPTLGIEIALQALAKIHDFAVAGRRPNGAENGLHDGNGNWEGSHGDLMLRERQEFRHRAGLPDTQPPLSQFFPRAGQVSMRTGWGEDAAWMSFDASTWGGAHNHLSHNAIQLHAHGRTLLMDPGAINYDMGDPAMFYGKSTRAHNTVSINGWNQFSANPDWTKFWSTPGCDAVASSYSGGYWPGRFGWWFDEALGQGFAAIHQRTLVWIKDRAAIVIDNLCRWDEEKRGDHAAPSLELNWTLAPAPVHLDPENHRAWTSHPESNLLLLFPRMPDDTKMSVHVGEKEPMRGWAGTPDRSLGNHPAVPLLTLECNPWKDMAGSYVSILVPFAGTVRPEVTAVVTPPAHASDAWCLELSWGDGSRDTLHWSEITAAHDGTTKMLGTLNDFDTDASILWLRRDVTGAPTDGAALDGTRFRWSNGNTVPIAVALNEEV